MSYEERDRKISFKWIIAASIVILIIVMFVILLISSKKSKDTILNCTASNSFGDIVMDRKVILYKNNDNYQLDYITNFKSSKNLKINSEDDFREYIKNRVNNIAQNRLDDINNYYDYVTNVYDDHVEMKLQLYINSNSETAYTKFFGFNILDSSKEELLDYFENGGMRCNEV